MRFYVHDESVIVHRCEIKSDVVIATDLDFTLIKPAQRRKFPRTTGDMVLMPGVIGALRKIHNAGARLVIFTNQKGKTFEYVSERCTVFINLVRQNIDGFDCDIFASIRDDKYRKPFTGMFELVDDIDDTNIVYAGDAIMRPGDFSASDAAFAYNCGMQLISEKTFIDIASLDEITNETLKTLQTHIVSATTPADIISQCETFELTNEVLDTTNTSKRCFIMVGPPCSGKSSASEKIKTKFMMSGRSVCVINMDTLKTEKKCMIALNTAINTVDVIIVDNCNASIDQRNKYIDKLPDDVMVTYVLMKTPQPLINILNKVRNIESHISIPTIAYRMYYRKYEPISLNDNTIECFEFNTNTAEWWHDMWI